MALPFRRLAGYLTLIFDTTKSLILLAWPRTWQDQAPAHSDSYELRILVLRFLEFVMILKWLRLETSAKNPLQISDLLVQLLYIMGPTPFNQYNESLAPNTYAITALQAIDNNCIFARI